ncbi:MAG: hypothetical protein NC344_00005 [Bacteroidales bacterium]|nr:hypothetical protein [Bacteroidales bacterium]MCM1146219.1 hypothetical protein [Bacteroidales bacterium]MCM1205343.1 hypothetical protein [Bacillota bacterium]MCM1509570.1 hypothetical protein [Clostridium sp.]
MTASDIKSIVFTGGSIIIDAKNYTVSDLRSIAFTAKSKNVKVIIRNASVLTASDCKLIAFSNGGLGNVFLDFTK